MACEHEDYPCCGCGNDDVESCDGERFDDYEDNMTDAEADADVLKSAGWGTDEDYGYYGDDTPMGDLYGGE